MRIFLFLSLIVNSAFAFEAYNFSLIFGSTNLSKVDGEDTYGTGLSLRSELFFDQNYGLVLSAGTYQTESDTLVGKKVTRQYNGLDLQGGVFTYFLTYFRAAVGLAYSKISETHRTSTETFENDYNEIGGFYQIGFKYPLKPMVVGVDYFSQQVGDFSSRGFFLLLGFVF
jgi:hypothetical protein